MFIHVHNMNELSCLTFLLQTPDSTLTPLFPQLHCSQISGSAAAAQSRKIPFLWCWMKNTHTMKAKETCKLNSKPNMVK